MSHTLLEQILAGGGSIEDRAQIRAALTSTATLVAVKSKRKKAQTPSFFTSTYASSASRKLSKQVLSFDPSNPSLYYCGLCHRRMTTTQELTEHATTTSPHHAFFGEWPLHIKGRLLKWRRRKTRTFNKISGYDTLNNLDRELLKRILEKEQEQEQKRGA